MNRAVKILLWVGILIIAAVPLLQSQPRLQDSRSVLLTGVNLAGAEFNGHLEQTKYGQHYFYPSPSTVDYYATKGMNVIRLPVLWERVQPQLLGKLDETEMSRIDAVVNYSTAKGITVIIDVHNYAKYFNAVIGTQKLPPQAFGELWNQIAMRYKDNALIIFGLMNEPVELRAESWLEAANIAIENIRRTGSKNLVLVPGVGWTSAHGWMSWRYGTPNSEVMLKVVDPGNNFAYDVHQYFDSNYSGTNPECQSTEVGVVALKVFTQWARYHRKRGFLGEFGAGPDQKCLETLDRTLSYMAGTSTVWLGWTYWAGGVGWPEDFFSNLEPVGGQDRPQMKVLEKYTRYVPSVRGDEK